MPIRPPVYEAGEKETGGPNLHGGPSRTRGGGALSPSPHGIRADAPRVRSVDDFFQALQYFMKNTATVMEKRHAVEVDNAVIAAEVDFKIGMDDLKRKLKDEGIGVGSGQSEQYAATFIDRSQKLWKSIEERLPEEARHSFLKRTHEHYIGEYRNAQSRTDELLKEQTVAGSDRLKNLALGQAGSILLPNQVGDAVAYSEFGSYMSHQWHGVHRGLATASVAGAAVQATADNTVEARAYSVMTQDPQAFLDRLRDEGETAFGFEFKAVEDYFGKGIALPGVQGRLSAEKRASLQNQARARLHQDDVRVDRIEAKLKKANEDAATKRITEYYSAGDLDNARTILTHARQSGAINDATYRVWDSGLTDAAKRRREVDEDPATLLKFYADPEAYTLADIFEARTANKISVGSAKSLLTVKRGYEDKRRDRDWTEAVREGRELIKIRFGITPFTEFKSDARHLAYFHSVREFNDGVNRLDTPDKITALREDILNRQAPAIKISTEDYMVGLKRSVPLPFDEKMSPADNRRAFEQFVQRNPGRYSPAQMKRYRDSYDAIGEQMRLLEREKANDHGRAPSGRPQGGQGRPQGRELR